MRVEAFVHSPLLPESVAGSTWDGMAHSSDWFHLRELNIEIVFLQRFELTGIHHMFCSYL